MQRPNSLQIYRSRIDTVINYIIANLDQAPSLDELAAVAHFSSYHFHRIFVAVMGESVNFYTNRLRLEKAARLLKFTSDTVAEIAYQCGFSSPATFSRSFKQYFSTSPSNFRKQGGPKDRKNCKEYFPMHEYLVDMSLEEKQTHFPVTIKSFPRRKVAYVRVFDSYQEGVTLGAFEKLVAWAKQSGLFDSGQFFGMSLDDPMVTTQEKYRYEACLTVPVDAQFDLAEGIEMMELPPCQYATTTVSGDIRWGATATHYLFNDWLINSDYEPEHQYGLEIFRDNQNVCNWDHFDLELCIPVKPLKTIS